MNELRPLRFHGQPMVPDTERARHVLANSARDLPWLEEEPYHDRSLAIVGGGPSLAETWREIPKHADVWALNGAYDFLAERGIVADVHVLLDPRAENICFVQNPRAGTVWYLASQVHPDVFDALEGWPVVLWHTADEMERIEELMRGRRSICVIAAGSTVGLKALGLADTRGYRNLHLFGYDSSHRDEAGHAYDQPLNARADVVEVEVAGRKFRTAPAMARQAEHFAEHAQELSRRGTNITIYGDGLLPFMATLLDRDPMTTRQQLVEVVLDLVWRDGLTAGHGAEINAGAAGLSYYLLESAPDLRMTVHGATDLAKQRLAAFDGRVTFADGLEEIGARDFIFVSPDGRDETLDACLAKVARGFVSGQGYNRPEVRQAVEAAVHRRGDAEICALAQLWWVPLGKKQPERPEAA